jgi:hypothetical protein
VLGQWVFGKNGFGDIDAAGMSYKPRALSTGANKQESMMPKSAKRFSDDIML